MFYRYGKVTGREQTYRSECRAKWKLWKPSLSRNAKSPNKGKSVFTQHYLSFFLFYVIIIFSPKNQPMYFLMLIAVVIFYVCCYCCCSYQFSFSFTKSLLLFFPPKCSYFSTFLFYFCKSDTNPIYPDCFSTFFFYFISCFSTSR